MQPVSFFGEEGGRRRPNRRERRAAAARNRKEHKKQIQKIEARARKQFEALKAAQAAEEQPEVAKEYGFG